MFMRILPALFILYQNIQVNLIFSLYILSFDLHVFLTALTIYMVLQGMFFFFFLHKAHTDQKVAQRLSINLD